MLYFCIFYFSFFCVYKVYFNFYIIFYFSTRLSFLLISKPNDALKNKRFERGIEIEFEN